MNIPNIATLTDALYCTDGGTMVLLGVSTTSEQFAIQLNQRAIPTPDAGRLFFNDEMIGIRSSEENKVIQLLKNATIACSSPKEISTPENQFLKNAQVMGDDIKDFLTKPLEDVIQSFREQIVAFVESEEYVHIAKDGLPPLK